MADVGVRGRDRRRVRGVDVLQLIDVAIGVAEVRVEVDPVRRLGVQLEFHSLVGRIQVAEVLRRVRRQEDEEVPVRRLGVIGAHAGVEAAIQEFTLRSDLERIGDFGVEQIADTVDSAAQRVDAHARLIETAAAEPPAPAAVERDVIGRLVAHRGLGLRLRPGVPAHRSRNGRRVQELVEERSRRRARCVGARVLVVAQCRIHLPLLVEFVGRVGEQRPGIVVLRVGEERGARIVAAGARLLVHREDAEPLVDHVTGGYEALGVHQVAACDP